MLGPCVLTKVVGGWKEKVVLKVWVLLENFCMALLMEDKCEICGHNQILALKTSQSSLSYPF